jgi:phosphoserine phosphatase
MAADRPALATRPEYAALLQGLGPAVAEFGLPRVAIALVELFEGMTPEEYTARARDFIMQARHASGRTYAQMIYKPMLELLDALRVNGFSTFIVSGGGVEFVRAVGFELYGVPPEGIVGSAVTYELKQEGGRPRLLRTGRLLGEANEGAAKVSAIQGHLGRRPIFAAGNSAGDTEMLDYAVACDGPSLALLVEHDDADREYAYASEAGTFAATESIVETAKRSGWMVASMKSDWSSVF